MEIKAMELHLGVLFKRQERLTGEMRSVAQKIEMKDKDGNPMFDTELMKLEFAALDKKKQELEKATDEYESKVLELTKL